MRTWVTEPQLLSQLRIRPAAGQFTVWTRYACVAFFDTFKEAADYVRRACCF